MATKRRMKAEAEEEIRGRRSPGRKGKETADGVGEKQYQTVQSDSEDDVEMFESNPEGPEQQRKKPGRLRV